MKPLVETYGVQLKIGTNKYTNTYDRFAGLAVTGAAEDEM
jgi:hypothetical protein